jgi:ATP-binding protein involved in chromosome partitioning
MTIEQDIRTIISNIVDPITAKPLAISNIVYKKGHAMFAIEAKKSHLEDYLKIKKECEALVGSLEGVIKVTISLTEESVARPSKKAAIPHVKKIIVVASGKGGVGKSTIAANLAASLSAKGLRVGLADVDIYGPSVPKLFDIKQKPVIENDMMIPHFKYGIKLMSVGFLVDENDALIWRGPMTTKMLYQILRLTNWAYDGKDLDVLIVDTPPGTGDVHLSLAENYIIDGAIIVSTPQGLSVIDVKKGIDMFNKFEINIIGIIENMSYYQDDKLHKHYIFGKGQVREVARSFNIKFLGEIPMVADISHYSDKGKPLPYALPKSAATKIFQDIANNL